MTKCIKKGRKIQFYNSTLFFSAAYSTEKVKIFKQPTPPSYSFGSRTRFNKRDATPAPNAYTVPPIFGTKTPSKRSAPAYIMAGRARVGGFSEDMSKVIIFLAAFLPSIDYLLLCIFFKVNGSLRLNTTIKILVNYCAFVCSRNP